MMGPYRDSSTPFKKTTKCYECGSKFKRGESKQILKVYDDPWADQPRTIAVHNNNGDKYGTYLDKLTDTSWADFRYFLCDECKRLIISQCPSNGWRSYQHETAIGVICVKCYQDDILKNGHDTSELKADAIPGDFYNTSDISNHNWSLVQGMSHCYITGIASGKEFLAKARELVAAGNKVLVNYDAIGIGGGEGYVSLYIKPAKIKG